MHVTHTVVYNSYCVLIVSLSEFVQYMYNVCIYVYIGLILNMYMYVHIHVCIRKYGSTFYIGIAMVV